MLFITLMTKISDTAEANYKYDKNSPKLSRETSRGERALEGRPVGLGCVDGAEWGHGSEGARRGQNRGVRRGEDGGKGRVCPVGPGCQRDAAVGTRASAGCRPSGVRRGRADRARWSGLLGTGFAWAGMMGCCVERGNGPACVGVRPSAEVGPRSRPVCWGKRAGSGLG